jgi:translation initiation factor 1
MLRKRRPPVYSTNPETMKRCPRCGHYPCRCPKPKSLPPEQQTATIQRETKGRGGKTVTLVRNLQLTPEDLKSLAKHLRKVCASGGTVKEGTIEIQGEHREQVADELSNLGYKTKFAGG